MENKRGSGIFLGVVGVATLVVAIIGATFAFFSASATANNTVDVTAYEFNVEVDLDQILPETSGKLIPLAANDKVTNGNVTNLEHALNTAGCVYKAKDAEGKEIGTYQACALYRLDVKNNGSAPISLNGVLETVEVEGAKEFQHLKYRALTVPEANISDPLGHIGLGAAAVAVPAKGTTIALDAITDLAPSTTKSMFFVVYLNEEGSANNAEMGAVYKAKVTYSDPTTGSSLSATFSVDAPEEDPEEQG